jgi:hypothetical protein
VFVNRGRSTIEIVGDVCVGDSSWHLVVAFVDSCSQDLGLSLGGEGEAESARIDIMWTTKSDYTFHYTDAEAVNFRWENHPHHGDYST